MPMNPLDDEACTHLEQAHRIPPRERACPECVARGDRWVHLRTCLTCGHVGCCDSSPNHHATRHFEATGHPLIRSEEPGEDWVWCYVDEVVLEAGDRTLEAQAPPL